MVNPCGRPFAVGVQGVKGPGEWFTPEMAACRAALAGLGWAWLGWAWLVGAGGWLLGQVSGGGR